MVSAVTSSRVVMVGTLALILLLPAEPAPAQFGGIAGAIIGNMMGGGGGWRYRGGGGGGGARHRHRRGGGEAEEPAAKTPPPASAAVLARGSSNVVFKGIVVSKSLGAVGVEDSIDTSKQHDWVRDSQRDYNGAIKNLLDIIDNTAKSNNPDGNSSLAQGDVTQHAIDRSVSHSYESAGLATFEQFVGEQWTNERLRVAILDRTVAEVPGLLVGNNFSRVEMAPIDDIITRAGRSIYKRTLETSELIAVNQATARFTRALFELHGPSANSDLRSGVEEMLLGASQAAFADYAERFVRSEFGVMLRYRAERILVDCLTSNVEEITTANAQAASKEQMKAKVDELSRGECRNWVINAIGDAKQFDPKNDETAIKPLPARAVWIAPGVPKTDASMFGRVSNNL